MVGLVAAALAFLTGPRPATLGPESTGDPTLAERVRQAAQGGAHRGLSVALIEQGRIRVAGVGVTGGPGSRPVEAGTPFEIGSITKAMTGMLLAGSGLPPGTRIQTLLPRLGFDDPAIASATVAELASHRAGLPRVRLTPRMLVMSYLSNLTGVDPYAGVGPADVLGELAGASASGKGEVGYSNVGLAAVGLALAEREGLPYGRLLRTRLLDPLGMHATRVLGSGDPLPAGHAHGSKANGMPMDPWRGTGYQPAGVAVWSTAPDLATLVKATMEGTAPGADAATPRFTATDRERIGYGWFTTTHGSHQVTWHNGGTGGFRSFAGFERASGRGVVVLGNTDAGVDGLALRLLGVDASDEDDSPPYFMIVVALILTFSPGLEAFFSHRPAGRAAAIRKLLWGVLSLVLALAVGPWWLIPPVAWAAGAGLLAAGALRWRDVPNTPWSRRTWVGLAIPAAFIATCLLL